MKLKLKRALHMSELVNRSEKLALGGLDDSSIRCGRGWTRQEDGWISSTDCRLDRQLDRWLDWAELGCAVSSRIKDTHVDLLRLEELVDLLVGARQPHLVQSDGSLDLLFGPHQLVVQYHPSDGLWQDHHPWHSVCKIGAEIQVALKSEKDDSDEWRANANANMQIQQIRKIHMTTHSNALAIGTTAISQRHW